MTDTEALKNARQYLFNAVDYAKTNPFKACCEYGRFSELANILGVWNGTAEDIIGMVNQYDSLMEQWQYTRKTPHYYVHWWHKGDECRSPIGDCVAVCTDLKVARQFADDFNFIVFDDEMNEIRPED